MGLAHATKPSCILWMLGLLAEIAAVQQTR